MGLSNRDSTGLPLEGGTLSGALLLPAGTDGAPAIAFANDADGTGTGFYFATGRILPVTNGGLNGYFDKTLGYVGNSHYDVRSFKLFNSLGILQAGGSIASSHSLGTGAVGVSGALEVDGGAVYIDGANAQTTHITSATQSLTFAANPGDASKTTSGLIPVGAILLGITARVTTTGTNATSFNIGDGADVDMYGATIALTSGTTVKNTNYTAAIEVSQAAAGEVTVTGVGGNIFDMVIAITAHYIQVTAATS